jgi:hypothetical protein
MPNELTLGNAAGTGKEATAGMGDELVEHIEFRHLLENLNKAGPGVALIAHEKKSGVIFNTLAPRRPPLSGEIGAIII